MSLLQCNICGIMADSPGATAAYCPVPHIIISPYSVAFGVILSLLFVCFFCTVEDISTQDGAIGVKF